MLLSKWKSNKETGHDKNYCSFASLFIRFVYLCIGSPESTWGHDSKHVSYSKADDSEDINSSESEFQQMWQYLCREPKCSVSLSECGLTPLCDLKHHRAILGRGDGNDSSKVSCRRCAALRVVVWFVSSRCSEQRRRGRQYSLTFRLNIYNQLKEREGERERRSQSHYS